MLCEICHILVLPEFLKTAEILKDENITFVEVDCDNFQELCESNDIVGYPTFFYVSPKKRVEFESVPKVDTMLPWLKEFLQPAVQFLTSEEEADGIIESNDLVAIGTFPANDSKELEVYQDVAEKMQGDMKFLAIVTNDRTTSPSLVLYRKDYPPENPSSFISKDDAFARTNYRNSQHSLHSQRRTTVKHSVEHFPRIRKSARTHPDAPEWVSDHVQGWIKTRSVAPLAELSVKNVHHFAKSDLPVVYVFADLNDEAWEETEEEKRGDAEEKEQDKEVSQHLRQLAIQRERARNSNNNNGNTNDPTRYPINTQVFKQSRSNVGPINSSAPLTRKSLLPLAMSLRGRALFTLLDSSLFFRLASSLSLTGDSFPAVAIENEERERFCLEEGNKEWMNVRAALAEERAAVDPGFNQREMHRKAQEEQFEVYSQGTTPPADVTVGDVLHFLSEFFAGQLEPTIRSTKAPIVNPPVRSDGEQMHVVVLTGDTFNDIVFGSEGKRGPEQDVFVMFHVNWCSHCKQAKPEFEKLGQHFTQRTAEDQAQDSDSDSLSARYTQILRQRPPVLLCAIDLTTDDPPPQFVIEGYPTFLLFPAGDKQNPIQFDDKRNIPNWLAFLEEFGGNKEQIKEWDEAATAERKPQVEQQNRGLAWRYG
ncbi:Protein disulfide-isomerase [Monocercomonoides exilis]|uniref:Protein disulfide-isomerase n=1 Tax=Monocercomonoides exilis TaxID=2049356 RepID=UPI00355998AF|nr:Protein disulfide-isomerase [Monocercomonoides exilis]|eukprot:MONOS_2582.1-p1 / transcript=MONOS_2582.1 / gene=MONOS_2582 / organism=Monocercomonoides_exilis_PA203 / gene_product=Protein disulfide-isomerase / transcript_product=Protein disulfide-isomerase / location=Mono_scaffold00054:62278-64494(+) / protein_length=650 / sequence_SO=supercontig / SO=protein_coding / is_pseudo=false